MTAEEYLRKYPWAVVEAFLHRRYGDCMEDRTAEELKAELARYGHFITQQSTTGGDNANS